MSAKPPPPLTPYRPPAVFGAPPAGAGSAGPQITAGPACSAAPPAWNAAAAALRVANMAKCMNGDVTGDYVRTAVVRGEGNTVRTMMVRLAPEAVPQFVALLRMDFGVEPCALPSGTPDVPGALPCNACRSMYIRGSQSVPPPQLPPPPPPQLPPPPQQPLQLVVLGCRRQEWRHFDAPRFDFDLLAIDSDKLYLRNAAGVSPALAAMGDRLSFVMARVLSGRFCLLEPEARGGGTARAGSGALMRAAYGLICDSRREWVMDDALWASSWIVTRWARLLSAPHTVRTRYNDAAANGNSSSRHPCCAGDVCALCHEPFAACDVVVSLACNHNFHVLCHTASVPHGSGLATWFDHHDTCPCCRAAASSSPGQADEEAGGGAVAF
jgi:hypothetical protein